MNRERNHYQTLFLPETANQDQIRKAYLILVKKFHDDLNRSASPEERAFCENALKDINAAYEVLCKPVQRAAYDRSQVRPDPPASQPGGAIPVPVAAPASLHFGVVRPGDLRKLSFVLSNAGAPARSVRISVARYSWIELPLEVDPRLPVRVPVQVNIPGGFEKGPLKGKIRIDLDGSGLDLPVEGHVEVLGAAGAAVSEPRMPLDAPRAAPRRKPVLMAACPFCGFQNPEGVSICQHCEMPLRRDGLRCPYCGERLPSSACTCPGCGRLVTLW